MTAPPASAAPRAYPSHAAALLACPPGAYEADELVEVVVEKTALFSQRAQADRVLDLGALRTLIAVGLAGGQPALNVIDFGGAAGYHHAIARLAFGDRIALRWNVVETAPMARAAQRLAGGGLQFFDDLDAAAHDLGSIDLVLTSGALQYCVSPLDTLRRLLALQARRLFITRTPFSAADTAIITTQQSLLGDNGPGPLPARFQNKAVAYPVTYVPRRDVEALIGQHYRIALTIQEDAATLFAGDRPVNAYCGYDCVLRSASG